MPKNIKACLSHNTDDWKTPKEIYKAFMKKGYIDTFPYKADYNEINNLYLDQKLFINPPFSKMEEITEWIIDQAVSNKIALLIPSRTDTKYFRKLTQLKPKIIFIQGRLHYNDSKSAPFPSLLMLINMYDDLKEYAVLDQEELKEYIIHEL